METLVEKSPPISLYTLVLKKKIQMICWFYAFIKLDRSLGLL